MPYRLILVDRFIIIIGLALIISLFFLIAGGYYLVKLYYFIQMSSDTSRISKIVLRIFFYGIFAPIMVLFFANDMAIPLFAQPTGEQLIAYDAGTLGITLIEHRLNTGALYLVLIAAIGLTGLLYYVYNKKKNKKSFLLG